MTDAATPQRNSRKRACAGHGCRKVFRPRTSGGSDQRFCSKACRDRLSARRRYARQTHREAQ